MSNLLDITGDDIAQLADAELRELIGYYVKQITDRQDCRPEELHAVATRMLAMVDWMLLCDPRYPLLPTVLYRETRQAFRLKSLTCQSQKYLRKCAPMACCEKKSGI